MAPARNNRAPVAPARNNQDEEPDQGDGQEGEDSGTEDEQEDEEGKCFLAYVCLLKFCLCSYKVIHL